MDLGTEGKAGGSVPAEGTYGRRAMSGLCARRRAVGPGQFRCEREAVGDGHGPGARILKGHADWVLAVAVTPDGRVLATGSRDRTVKLWDISALDAQLLGGRGA